MESESTLKDKKPDEKVVIIGAGPAGLTAAYELSKEGVRSVVLEKDSVVGGLARTVNYRGYHFDITSLLSLFTVSATFSHIIPGPSFG